MHPKSLVESCQSTSPTLTVSIWTGIFVRLVVRSPPSVFWGLEFVFVGVSRGLGFLISGGLRDAGWRGLLLLSCIEALVEPSLGTLRGTLPIFELEGALKGSLVCVWPHCLCEVEAASSFRSALQAGSCICLGFFQA